MIRALILLGCGVALGYGVSVVEVGGRPLGQQIARVWRTGPVQRQIERLKAQVPEMAHRLKVEAPGLLPVNARERGHRGSDSRGARPSDHDRRRLDALVDEAQRQP